MSATGPRTTKCTDQTRSGRLSKAKQFKEAADIIDTLFSDEEHDLVDAYVTLLIHAGIAAADVICCARLGVHARGQDHFEAVGLLESVSKPLAQHLNALLKLKAKTGYSALPTSGAERKRAQRAATALVEAASRI